MNEENGSATTNNRAGGIYYMGKELRVKAKGKKRWSLMKKGRLKG
jgi:hypothetical protein